MNFLAFVLERGSEEKIVSDRSRFEKLLIAKSAMKLRGLRDKGWILSKIVSDCSRILGFLMREGDFPESVKFFVGDDETGVEDWVEVERL